MAKTELNSALHSIRGAIDRWVYRRVRGKMVITRRSRSATEPTAAQLEVRERFRLAAAYATAIIADPVARVPYDALAFSEKVPIREVIMTDFLNPPEVDLIDLSGYHGMVGDLIKIRALDDKMLMAVSVSIEAADHSVLESGAAMLTAGIWVYTATTARMAGDVVSVIATATDRPGHTGSKTESWTY